MSRLRNLGIVLVLLVATYQAMSWWYFPSGSLNYKLSVDVDDNGARYHGAGVYKVAYQSHGFWRTSETPMWSVGVVDGEAFAIDIGAKGTVFVLLDPNPFATASQGASKRGSTIPASAGQPAIAKYFGFYFNDLPTDHSTLATIDAFKQSQPPVDLESADLPMIVRFRDPAKLETVDLVDPEHLELSFGAGVTIVGVRAEITDEAATAGITKRLPWLLELRESFGKRLSIPYHNPMSRISVMSFKREF